jgi:hypothetical protein
VNGFSFTDCGVGFAAAQATNCQIKTSLEPRNTGISLRGKDLSLSGFDIRGMLVSSSTWLQAMGVTADRLEWRGGDSENVTIDAASGIVVDLFPEYQK